MSDNRDELIKELLIKLHNKVQDFSEAGLVIPNNSYVCEMNGESIYLLRYVNGCIKDTKIRLEVGNGLAIEASGECFFDGSIPSNLISLYNKVFDYINKEVKVNPEIEILKKVLGKKN